MAITINGSGTITGASTLATTVASPTFTAPNIDSASVPTVSGTAPLYMARVWCQYNNSQAIVGSANISSITSNGTGDVRLNFTTAMPDANYSAVGSTNEDGGTAKFCNVTQPAASNIRVITYNLAGTKVNNTYNFVAVFR